jgi:hypothetical protein
MWKRVLVVGCGPVLQVVDSAGLRSGRREPSYVGWWLGDGLVLECVRRQPRIERARFLLDAFWSEITRVARSRNPTPTIRGTSDIQRGLAAGLR